MLKFPKQTNIIFDFDSTFSKLEGLEELGKICSQHDNNIDLIYQKLKTLTEKAMVGDMVYTLALKSKLNSFSANKKNVSTLCSLLKNNISQSFLKNQDILLKNKENIYIVSNGFKDYILPVVTQFGLKEEHIFANTFLYDINGNVIGLDETNPLCKDGGGKATVIEKLNLKGNIIMVGDGFNDFQVKVENQADYFILFTENVFRTQLALDADFIASNLDDVLHSIPQLIENRHLAN